jgi:uncharacterized membrane protein
MKLRNIVFNCCFAINCLLLFFLLFEGRMVVPAWLQVTGRMHPLLLHFPIVLLMVYIVWALFVEKKNEANETIRLTGEWLLLLSALTSSLTAIAGLFLSKETGYDSDALLLHKWSGAAFAFLATAWYGFRHAIRRWNPARVSMAVVSVIVVVATGHQGAAITHGENFLLAPISEEEKQPAVLMEEAVIYAHMVKPILQEKCMSCHNTKKAKGDLVMETEELLLKGGKSGKLWDTTAAGLGLLLDRLHLPLDNKKHMPPTGKPQLNEQETEVLSLWIKGGANFTTRVMDLPETDPLHEIANNIFNTIETDEYNFAAADEKKVEALNTNYRLIAPLAKESPALSVKFFSAPNYDPAQLTELLPIKMQVVSLNLDKMPVKDEEMKTISQFSNLRKLSLSFTSITGSNLQELTKLNELRQVSFSGTAVTKEKLLPLAALKQLSQLYIWNTHIAEADIAALKNLMKGVAIETGFDSDTGTMQLPPPVLVNDEQVVKLPYQLKMKHPVNGVSIRYTLDGSEPDSLKSPEYKGPLTISKSGPLKARAYKKGWTTSEPLENYYFTASHKIDSAKNLLPPDDLHKGNGAGTLTDLVKGEVIFTGSDRWLGFNKNKMETLMWFNDTVTISNVIVGTLLNTGGSIMPPASVEIWGGNDERHLKKITRFVPAQPGKQVPAGIKPYEINFDPVTLKYVKIIAEPVSQLPKWHPGKGKKGWLFVDEVFVN